ncbi:3'-5' exonuclease [Anditalea andensis]|uniref:3'-5' exonuclease n=1 Tax=Anditalea andensis TaxID=1048983 RepID=A0A074KSA0_9BACT|nr:3'-5' exonuclease [Anditalea andensis]KEO72836.1 3'-5' exonuclease [Anditalea andensis]
MADFFSDLRNILFLDIETVSQTGRLEELDTRLQSEWLKKHQQIIKDENISPEDSYFQKGGIYAEFGQVICVGVGYYVYNPDEDKLHFRTKTFGAASENEILWQFRELLEKKRWTLCAHNGKEFDFPYLCRRMLVNQIPLPDVLQLAGKRPWEIRHIDTLELWKFGDYKHYTRLELLAALFGIASSKEDIDGSQVNETYYKDQGLDTIRLYCLRDVEVTARLYLAYQGLPSDLQIEIVNLDQEKDPSSPEAE